MSSSVALKLLIAVAVKVDSSSVLFAPFKPWFDSFEVYFFLILILLKRESAPSKKFLNEAFNSFELSRSDPREFIDLVGVVGLLGEYDVSKSMKV